VQVTLSQGQGRLFDSGTGVSRGVAVVRKRRPGCLPVPVPVAGLDGLGGDVWLLQGEAGEAALANRGGASAVRSTM